MSEWSRHLSSPGGVVSTCSTDQPLRHRRSSVSTRMPVRCDHPMRVSVSPFHVSTSSRSCRRADGDRSSLGDPERGRSTVRYKRRRSGSSRSDRSVSRASARRNSSLGSGRRSGGGFRRGRRSSVTSKPPPPRRQVGAEQPTPGKSVVHAQDAVRVRLGPPRPLSWRRSQPTGRSVASRTACTYHRSRDAGSAAAVERAQLATRDRHRSPCCWGAQRRLFRSCSARVVQPTLPGSWLPPLSTRARLEAGPRPDGLPFDPWPRLGGRILRAEPESLRISGTVAHWQAWVGMAFPNSGRSAFPGRAGAAAGRPGSGHRALSIMSPTSGWPTTPSRSAGQERRPAIRSWWVA